MTVSDLFAVLSGLPAEAKLVFHADDKEYRGIAAGWEEKALIAEYHIVLEDGE